MRKLTIKYLSDGPKNTGGYFHESFWFEKMQEFYSRKHYEVIAKEIREDEYHSGFWSTFKWFSKLFFKGNAELIIVPGRCALPVLLRNIFSSGKVLTVFHSLNDNQLKKNKLLNRYYSLLFKFIKSNKNFHIITVAHFWSAYFYEKRKIHLEQIILLPNLFDKEDYSHYQAGDKDRNIHLGMWSTKLDKVIYDLASRLSHKGYNCFFTTPQDIVSIGGTYGYKIVYCATHNEYKSRVANSLFTIALPGIPEGWSRVAHESFLLGTPVIGFNNSGLGELISEAGGYIADNIYEIINIVEENDDWIINDKFLRKFHSNRAGEILESYKLFR